MADLPTIRWGIVATGMISSWFVEDLLLERSDSPVRHIVQAIGSSSLEKGHDFAAKYCPHASPSVYGSYQGVYDDADVDIIYIGTPHAMHKRNCLDAIAAGKNVLCEKAFTLNARDALEVIEAARTKGTYLAEAMWLRHRPLVRDLQRMLHEERIIGDVFRAVSDFGMEVDFTGVGLNSRLTRLDLGAGSLLDQGVYSLTWILLALDTGYPGGTGLEMPKVLATQTRRKENGVEVASSALLHYASTGRQGIVSSTLMMNNNPDLIACIHGTGGMVELQGFSASSPSSFRVYPKFVQDLQNGQTRRGEGKTFVYETPGRGYQYEADGAALDVLAGRKESKIMPLSETYRVMQIMDEIRRQGGTVYPGES